MLAAFRTMRISVEFIHEFLQLTLHLVQILSLVARVCLVRLVDRLVCSLGL